MRDVSSRPGDRTGGPGDRAPDGPEARLGRALHDAAAAVEPTPWSAPPVLLRAERTRRNRWIAVCLPVVGAAVAVIAVAAGAALGPGEPRPVAPATVAPLPHPTTTHARLVVWPKVRVVAPDEAVDLGGGPRMRLTAGERCVDWKDGSGWDCRDESDKDGNQPQGTVNTQAYGYAGGTRYALLYRGPSAPARMSVTVDGHVWPAQVVTLAGHPGWAAGYLDIPASAVRPDPFVPPDLMVWDTRGVVIASLDRDSSLAL